MITRRVKRELLNKTTEEIENIITHPDLTHDERWLIYHIYGKQRMVVNVCHKLHMSEPQFYITQKLALTKLYYILELNKTL